MASSDRLSPVRYQQGEWFGVVRNGTVVLLGPDTPHALIDTVWELLASAPEAHEVLHEVTDAFGVSLSRIPPFGIIDSKDALRVFLRGDLELLVHMASGQEQITGRDVTTWTERRLADAASYSLRIGGGADSAVPLSASPLNSLPLTEGVVLLSVLDVAPREAVPATDAATATDAVTATEAATVAVAEPAPRQDDRHAVPDRVSDETMIGYTEADLGLTIAPGHSGLGTESSPSDEPAASDAPTSSAESAAPDESAAGGVASQEPATGESEGYAPATPDSTTHPDAGGSAGEVSSAEEPATEPAADEVPAVEEAHGESGAAVHTSTTDPLVPSLENTTNYDHLWDKTVMRNIEDAAVRVDDASDDDAPVSKSPGTPGTAEPAQEPHTPEPLNSEPPNSEPLKSERPLPEPPVPGPGDQLPAAPHAGSLPPAAQSPTAQSPAANEGTGLIDSVPWLRNSSSVPRTGAAPSAAPSVSSIPAGLGSSPAPQLPGGWPPAPSPAPVDEDSDHDGQTIMKSSLDADHGNADKQSTAAPEGAVANGPSVLARVCPQGHANPPTYPQCSVCGTDLAGDAEQVPRPRLGRMRLSTGEVIDLDQSLIIGRQPSVSRVQGGTMPKLVQVESPGGDISRSHVEVRLEGWHVMLCDLKATNGTVLIREGQAPRRLAQNEMAILLDGDIAELGDDISLRFEEIL